MNTKLRNCIDKWTRKFRFPYFKGDDEYVNVGLTRCEMLLFINGKAQFLKYQTFTCIKVLNKRKKNMLFPFSISRTLLVIGKGVLRINIKRSLIRETYIRKHLQ